MRIAAVFILAGSFLAGCGPTPASRAHLYEQRTPTEDGTGKVYMGREIARVMGHQGAAWLEREERTMTELPYRVLDAMRLDTSDVVADIGAGTGYFTFRLADRLPAGLVLAVDIQPEMLAYLRGRMDERGSTNVRMVLGTEQDPNLPEDSVDVALMVDSYHEFSFPHEMMAGIVRALRPGGHVVLVEYRGEDPTVPIKSLHKMTEAQAIREMQAVGLHHRETLDVLPQQHLMIFEKPLRQEAPLNPAS